MHVKTSEQGWFQVALRYWLTLISLFSPAALLGMGVALPHVVNLQYVTPEIFIQEVRAFRCDRRGLLHLWREAGLGEVSGRSPLSFPSCLSTQWGPGSARPRNAPLPRPCNESAAMRWEILNVRRHWSKGFTHPHQISYRVTVDSDQLCCNSVPLDRHDPPGVWGRMREGVFPGLYTNLHRADGRKGS